MTQAGSIGLKERILKRRREAVFGIAVLLAGLAITTVCVSPSLMGGTEPRLLLPTEQQEKFFFDLFAICGGCWLVSWVCALNNWSQMARVGQWLGIILLCLNEAIMFEVWHDALAQPALSWVGPILLQTYLMGCFFAFFTLPALTQSGNRTLTGLGTLVLVLPWLFGHDCVVVGSEFLNALK